MPACDRAEVAPPLRSLAARGLARCTQESSRTEQSSRFPIRRLLLAERAFARVRHHCPISAHIDFKSASTLRLRARRLPIADDSATPYTELRPTSYMASFFHRPNITPSWNQRIYPVREPSFATTSPSPPSPPPPTRDDSSNGRPRARSSVTSREVHFGEESAPHSPPLREAPPPIYYPGPAQRRLSAAARGIDEAVPRGHIASINSATTSTCIVKWLKHPAAPEATRPRDPESHKPQKRKGWRDNWPSWIRLPLIWRALRQDPEVLWDGWPVEFGGTRPVPWEVTTATGDRDGDAAEQGASLGRPQQQHGASSIDSGVALTPMPSADNPPLHPLEAQYRRRIAELNSVISESLILTRLWLGLTELTDIIWFVCLIIALASGGGKQTGFLKGVEVSSR